MNCKNNRYASEISMIIRKLFFLLLVQAIFLTGFGQDAYQAKIDSMESLIKLKSGAEKFDEIIVLMRVQLKKNPKTTLELSRQAETLAFSIGDSLRIVKAKFARGFIYRRLDSVTLSIRVLEDALPIAKINNYNEELSKILNTIAIGYSFIGNTDKALAAHFQSIDLNERVGNKEDIAITYNNIGFIYFKLRNFENALLFYQKSLDVKKAISSEFDFDRVLINMALCYNQLRRYKEAEDFVKRGLNICKKECNSFILVEAKFALGVASSQQGRTEEAIRHFEASLLTARQLNDKLYQADNLWNLALLHESQQHHSDALNFLREAEKIATEINYLLSLIDVYKLYSRIYHSQNDFQNASLYQSRYITLKDSIYSIDLIKNLSKVETDFTARDSIKALNSKNETLGAKLELIKGQRSQFIFVAAIILLSLTLSIMLLRARKKQAQAIDNIADPGDIKQLSK